MNLGSKSNLDPSSLNIASQNIVSQMVGLATKLVGRPSTMASQYIVSQLVV